MKIVIIGLFLLIFGAERVFGGGASLNFIGLGGTTTYCCPTSVSISAQITAGGMGRTNNPPLIFTIELSDVGGNFPASPTILATFSTPDEHWYDPASSGIITGTITCPITAGSYKVRIHVTGGKNNENTYSDISIGISIGNSTNAGPDQAICSGGTATLSGAATGATSVIWSGGLGSYAPNNTTLNPVYTPTAAEISAGSVTLTLTTVGGTCGSGSDQMTISLKSIPTINSVTPASRCGTGTLTLGATASAGTINWYSASTGGSSLGIGTSFTTPSLSTTTTYYVDATLNGCTTTARTAVIATVAGASDLWIGGTLGALTDWNTASNWSCGVPTATTDVTIPSVTYYPVIGAANGICRTITDMGGGSISGTGSLTIAGNAGVAITNIMGTAAISCPVIMPSSASITVAGSLTVSGAISGAGTGITKSGSGILIFSGANSFTGTTTISVGTLNIQNANALGTTAGGTTVSNGATLEMQGGISIGNESLSLDGNGVGGVSGGALFNVSGNNSWGGPITLNGQTRINSNGGTLTLSNTVNLGSNSLLIQGVSTNANTISGVISGTGFVNKVGGGVWALSGANTFSGGVLLYNGTLNVNNAQALGSIAGGLTIGGVGNTVTIDNTSGSAIATLNYPMAWNDNFTFSGTNALNLGTGAVTLQESRQVTVAANTLTVGGIISGSGLGLTKLGSGMLTLTGNNSYSGSTTITAGELRLNPSVNSSPASQFILNSGILSTTNITSGRTITSSSTLQLTDNSNLNLGSAAHTLSFANSSGTSWSAGKTLTINGWQGNWNGTTGTAGKIFMGSSGGLSVSQLTQIRFFNGTKYFAAILLSTGEMVPAGDFITTLAIGGSPFCAGASVSIPFTYSYASSFTSATTFTAQLSDASGSFTSPVTLGTIAGNASGSQTITGTIPLTTLTGTAYKIRVISDIPVIIGTDNGSNLTINGTPVIPVQTTTICSGIALNFVSVNNPPTTIVPVGTIYTWTNPVVTGGITGGSLQATPQTSVNQTLSNPTNTVQTATYTVTPTAGSCPGTPFTLTVTVNPSPTITNTPLSQTICSGGSTTLITLTSGVSGTTFAWTATATTGVSGFTASGTGTIPVQTTSTTGTTQGTVTYAITPTAAGCIGALTNYTVLVNPSPTVTNTPLNQTICSGGSTTLVTLTSGVSGTTFAWTASATTGVTGFTASGSSTIPVQTISTTGTTQGTVTYAITPTAAGCSGAVTNYTVLVNPGPSINSMTAAACSGTAFTVTPVDGTNGAVPAGTTYSWGLPSGTGFTGGATGTGATNISGTLTNTTSGEVTATYTVTPTSGSCAGSTFTVTVTLPSPLIAGGHNINPVTSCVGYNPPQLDINVPVASGGLPPYTYQWFLNGSPVGTNSLSYDPPQILTAGIFNYNATVTDACGSSASTVTKTITIVDDPIVGISGGGNICINNSLILTGSITGGTGIMNYQWQSGPASSGPWTDIPGAASSTYSTSTSALGTIYYQVKISPNVASCNNTSSVVWVKVNPLPSLFNVTGGGSYCSGNSGIAIVLDGSEAGVNYQLQLGGSNTGGSVAGTGAALSFGLLTAAGTYTVIATNSITGCTLPMTGSQTITINPLPTTSAIYHR